MSELQTFSFLPDLSSVSSDVRLITNEAGDPWFVLVDLLRAMQSSTKNSEATASIEQGLGKGFVATLPLPSAGGVQQTIIVAEAAATYLLSRSNTEAGRKLNRYLHVEVLPAIRKTGAYAVPQAHVTPVESDQLKRAIDLSAGAVKAAEAFGLSGNQALLSANRMLRTYTGVDLLEALGHAALPAPVQEALLTPSDIAIRLELPKNKANQLLIEAGLQTSSRDHNNRLVYEPTELGRRYAEFLDVGKMHSDGTPVRQLKWRTGVVEFLRKRSVH